MVFRSLPSFGPFFFPVLLFFFSFTLSASAVTLTSNLSLGSRGSEVTSLQTFLKSTGDFTHPTITGYFGPVTQAAVQKYQCRVLKICSGTPSTNGYGNVGPKTRASMNAGTSGGTTTLTPQPTTPTPTTISPPTIQNTLSFGMTSNEVRLLQEYLRYTGDYTYPSITGFYGTATQEAVQRFQTRKGIATSGTTGYGVVNASTRAAIQNNTEPKPTTSTTNPSSGMTLSINASPQTVPYLGTPTITWSSTGARSCVVTGSGLREISGLQGAVSPNALTGSALYILTCTNQSGERSQRSVTVSMEGQTQQPTYQPPTIFTNTTPTAVLFATPAQVNTGNSAALAWFTTNVSSCTASGGWSGTKTPEGNQLIQNITSSMNFMLNCIGLNGGSTQASAAVALTQTTPTTPTGTPQCNDDIDNDGDGKVDWDGGPGTTQTVTTQGSTGPTAGLVAHWKFDETSGTTATDSAGNNTGTLNGPTWTGGKYGNAVSFDGTNDKISFSSASSLTMSSFTEATWVYFDTIPAGWVTFLEHDRFGNNWYGLWKADGNSRFTCITAGGSTLTGHTDISAGRWYHVACTFNAATGAKVLYIDGVADNSTTASGLSPGAMTFSIGASIDNIEYLDGKMDDVRLYNRALSASEVSELYNGTSSGGTTNTVITPGIPDSECTDANDTSESGSTTPTTPTSAPTVSLIASPTSVPSGTSSTIGWFSTNATSCTASGGWSGSKGTGGSQSVTPSSTTNYSLSCTGTGGTTQQSVTVTVTTATPAQSYYQGSYPSGGGGTAACDTATYTSSVPFASRLFSKPAICIPIDPFVVIFHQSPTPAVRLYGPWTVGGTMTKDEWKNVYRHVGHIGPAEVIRAEETTGTWASVADMTAMQAAQELGRYSGGGFYNIPGAEVRSLYRDPIGLNITHWFHDDEPGIRGEHQTTWGLLDRYRQWFVDEMLAARLEAGKPAPLLISNFNTDGNPQYTSATGGLAGLRSIGFTAGDFEYYSYRTDAGADVLNEIFVQRPLGLQSYFGWIRDSFLYAVDDTWKFSASWIGIASDNGVPVSMPPNEWGSLITLGTLQGSRSYFIFTSMSDGHLGGNGLSVSTPEAARVNADALYAMAVAASAFESTKNSFKDSTYNGDAPLLDKSSDVFFVSRKNGNELWFAGVAWSGSASVRVQMPISSGTLTNLSTNQVTPVSGGVATVQLSRITNLYYFRP